MGSVRKGVESSVPAHVGYSDHSIISVYYSQAMDTLSVNTFKFKLSDDHAIDSPKKLSPHVAPCDFMTLSGYRSRKEDTVYIGVGW